MHRRRDYIKRFLILIVFLIRLSSLSASGNEQICADGEKNILIIHSYHQGLEWTDNISRGILDEFNDSPRCNLVFEYMDTKRNHSKTYIQNLLHFLEIKNKESKYSGIIASDNAAYIFLAQHGEKLFGETPIVFCGVNKADTNLLHNCQNYFLYHEKADHLANLNMIAQIYPEKDTIVIINDNTLTGTAIKQELEQILPKFRHKQHIRFISSFSIDSLQQEIGSLSDHNAIYLLVINRDRNGKFVSYRNGITQIRSATELPVFGSWDFYLNKGIIGGKIISGYQQGAAAAQKLKQMMSKGYVKPEFNHDTVENKFYFDYLQLKKHNIARSKLPAGSEIINRDMNDYLKLVILLLILALLVIIILIINLVYKRKRQAALEKKVEEKTEFLRKIISNKDQFLSLMAHDLRSPMGNILTMSQMMIDPEDPPSEAEKTDLSNRIAKLSTKTFNLLEDLIFWGKMRFKNEVQFEIKEFNLQNIISDIRTLFNINPYEIQIHNLIKENFTVKSDEFILKYIIRNLVQNALKYSYRNGKIEIGATGQNGWVEIWVKDWGIGMSEEMKQSILNKKPIQTKGNKGQSSYGLGLATIIDYLELLGGNLQIESAEGEGSKFTIKLAAPKDDNTHIE